MLHCTREKSNRIKPEGKVGSGGLELGFFGCFRRRKRREERNRKSSNVMIVIKCRYGHDSHCKTWDPGEYSDPESSKKRHLVSALVGIARLGIGEPSLARSAKTTTSVLKVGKRMFHESGLTWKVCSTSMEIAREV